MIHRHPNLQKHIKSRSLNMSKRIYTTSNSNIIKNPNRFYVYLWCYEHDVIWVGKGSYNRAYTFSSRENSIKLQIGIIFERI